MKLALRLVAITVLLYGATVYAFRPIGDAPPEMVIEGYIEAVDFGIGTTPRDAAIVVNSSKIYVSPQTVIKMESGYGKIPNLKVGAKVQVHGYLVKGALIARTIYVFGK